MLSEFNGDENPKPFFEKHIEYVFLGHLVAMNIVSFDCALLVSDALCCSIGWTESKTMKAFLQTVHRWTQILWNLLLALLIGMFIYVILKTGWLMLNAPDKMTVEVISSTAVEEVAPVATNNAPPTEAVVEKLVEQTNVSDRISLGGKVRSEWQ